MKLIPRHTYIADGVKSEQPHGYLFWCPGCEQLHPFTTVSSNPARVWSFNGDMERPTFAPSLLCNGHDAASRCHCYVTGGMIQFLGDCWHLLKGKTVPMVDLDSETMAPKTQTSGFIEQEQQQ